MLHHLAHFDSPLVLLRNCWSGEKMSAILDFGGECHTFGTHLWRTTHIRTLYSICLWGGTLNTIPDVFIQSVHRHWDAYLQAQQCVGGSTPARTVEAHVLMMSEYLAVCVTEFCIHFSFNLNDVNFFISCDYPKNWFWSIWGALTNARFGGFCFFFSPPPPHPFLFSPQVIHCKYCQICVGDLSAELH